jgi:DNA-binding LacI/PurR family transcriptional regulator
VITDKIKNSSEFISSLNIDKESPLPIHIQLTDVFRRKIIQNRMRPGTLLPAERLIAEKLQINRDTVHRAYETLIGDGFLTRPQGRRSILIAEQAREKYKPSFPAVGIMMPTGFANFVKLASRNTMTYLSGILDRATELGHSTIMLSLPAPDTNAEEVDAWMENFVGRTIGVIHLGEGRKIPDDKPLSALFGEKRIPQVFVSGYSDLSHISSIYGDAQPGCMAAAKLLRDQGHRNVGIFRPGWSPENSNIFKNYADGRTETMLECFGKFGLTIKKEWVAEYRDFEIKQYQLELDRIFSLKEKPTAIWCQNDDAAFSVLAALKNKNIRVPEDVSLLGFDDIESARPGKPFLTTVSQPRYDIGKKAIDLVVDLFEAGVPGMSRQVKLPTSLVVRDSVGIVKEGK